jgi:hypothetical protein
MSSTSVSKAPAPPPPPLPGTTTRTAPPAPPLPGTTTKTALVSSVEKDPKLTQIKNVGIMNMGNGLHGSPKVMLKTQKKSNVQQTNPKSTEKVRVAPIVQNVLSNALTWTGENTLRPQMRKKVIEFLKKLGTNNRVRFSTDLASKNPTTMLEHMKKQLLEDSFAKRYDHYTIRNKTIGLSPDAEDLNKILRRLINEIRAKESQNINTALYVIPEPIPRTLNSTSPMSTLKAALMNDEDIVMKDLKTTSDKFLQAFKTIAETIEPYMIESHNFAKRAVAFLERTPNIPTVVKTGKLTTSFEKGMIPYRRLFHGVLMNLKGNVKLHVERVLPVVDNFLNVVKTYSDILKSIQKARKGLNEYEEKFTQLKIPENIKLLLPHQLELQDPEEKLSGIDLFERYKVYFDKFIQRFTSTKAQKTVMKKNNTNNAVSRTTNAQKTVMKKNNTNNAVSRTTMANFVKKSNASRKVPPPSAPKRKSGLWKWASLVPSAGALWSVKNALTRPKKKYYPNLSTAYLPQNTSNVNRTTAAHTMRTSKQLVLQNYWRPELSYVVPRQQGRKQLVELPSRQQQTFTTASSSSTALLPAAALLAYSLRKKKATPPASKKRQQPKNKTRNIRQLGFPPKTTRSGMVYNRGA